MRLIIFFLISTSFILSCSANPPIAYNSSKSQNLKGSVKVIYLSEIPITDTVSRRIGPLYSYFCVDSMRLEWAFNKRYLYNNGVNSQLELLSKNDSLVMYVLYRFDGTTSYDAKSMMIDKDSIIMSTKDSITFISVFNDSVLHTIYFDSNERPIKNRIEKPKHSYSIVYEYQRDSLGNEASGLETQRLKNETTTTYINYYYKSFDEKGNWTRRFVKRSHPQYGHVFNMEFREITYE